MDNKQIMVASRHGVDASVGANDATSALNTLFAAAKMQGCRYIYFDIPHTYNVSGELTNVIDLLLIGEGAIIHSSNLANYFVRISNPSRTFTGKINSFSDSDDLLKTAANAIHNKRLNITIWGDSISISGSDIIGAKYGHNRNGGGKNTSDGITPTESYVSHLLDMLMAKFQDVTFNIYNRSVGGLTLQHYNSSHSFNGVTKPWIEHIKDTAPDILIIAFGINTSIPYSKSFLWAMDQVLSGINTFDHKPSVCWLTTPRPAMTFSRAQGGKESQLVCSSVAYVARHYGIHTGGYVIDVGRLSDILRTGVDLVKPSFRQTDFTVSGNFKRSDSAYVLSADGENLCVDSNVSDFVLEFELNMSGASGTSEQLTIGYNRVPELDGAQSILQISPNIENRGALTHLAQYADREHTPETMTAEHTAAATWNDGGWRSVRMEKRGGVFDVFINGVQQLHDLAHLNNLPGNIQFSATNVLSAVYKLRNLRLLGGFYNTYTPTTIENEMWGGYGTGGFMIKPIYGGNGLNHPSAIGIKNVYIPALQEFVDDLAAHRWKYLILN